MPDDTESAVVPYSHFVAPETVAGRSVVYPRAYCEFFTTMEGAAPGSPDADVSTGIVPTRATVVYRSHSQAGEATITVHGSALPFPVQRMAGMFLKVYLGCVPSVDDLVGSPAYLRFVGYVDEVQPKLSEQGTEVEVKARDMSAIFRDFHPLPAELNPLYSDTLGSAIERIIKGTPGALEADGTPRVTLRQPTFDGALRTTGAPLAAIAPGVVPATHVPLPRPCTAMQAIEHVAGLLGVPYRFDLNELVLRPPAEERDANEPLAATLSFGDSHGSLLEVQFDRKFIRNRRGVRVIAFSPADRSRVFADWPPEAEARLVRPPARVGNSVFARLSANSHHGLQPITPRVPPPVERDVFPAPQGVYDRATMLQIAKQLYDQRSVQEADGQLVTPLWTNEVLAIRNASRFRLRVNADLEAQLREEQQRSGTSWDLATTDNERAVNLIVRALKCDRTAAEALVRAYRRQDDEPLWYARTVTHEFVAEGVCKTTIEFMNIINVTTSLAGFTNPT
jgi:hypothetical protein